MVLLAAVSVSARDKSKPPIHFKDSLDGAFDLSDWVINYNGFIPLPVLITEPAVGGFGGALAPIFIKQQPPRKVNGKLHPMPPNITAAAGGYTLNGSWMAGAGRVATLPRWGVRYTVGAGYANVNLDYYKTVDLPAQGPQDFRFGVNIRTVPVYVALSKLFADPRWSVELHYLFAHTELEPESSTDNAYINQLIDQKDYSSNLGALGLKGVFDGRDNFFTSNRGVKTYLDFSWNNPAFGSDYRYSQLEGALYWYQPLKHWWVLGSRFDMQQVFGQVPFYVKPFLDMRGVPAARYQGKTTLLAELEQRFDVSRRWSLIALVGTGKAFDDYGQFGSATWVYNYGTGIRYLIARKLGLRMGVDVAASNDSWGYYVVFGSAWSRQ